jgi:transposase-like protein
MKLGLLWLAKVSVDSVLALTCHSEHTVCNFYRHFRQLTSSALKEEDTLIGGLGITVEIDETKLGKRKYHRGHRVDGVWVLVGIEKLPRGRIFLVKIEDRSQDTLLPIIQHHVHPDSEIETDLWKGYNGLSSAGFVHRTVNHSRTFVDPSTSACTNTVEGLNSGLKRRIPIRNRTIDGIEGHLGEYIWRRQNAPNLFDAFIEVIKDLHYDII